MAQYEFWLCDDYGKRISLLKDYFFVSYTRSTIGFGTILIGLSYDEYKKLVTDVYRPDFRIDVWRSPAKGYPMKRERSYLIRKIKVYERKEDSVRVIELFGRDGLDLLNRRCIIQPAGTFLTSFSNQIDNIMILVVNTQLLYGGARDVTGTALDPDRYFPQTEFSSQVDVGLGPTITSTISAKNVLDVMKDLRDMSFQLNRENSTNRKIYFDVVEKQLSGTQFGYEFRTFADLRGQDRTAQLEFSVENGNMEAPYYEVNYLEELNFCYVYGQGRGSSRPYAQVDDPDRVGASRWNRIETIISATGEPDSTALDYYGYRELDKNRPDEVLYCTFINTEGSETQPRSLYGIDWDMGDLVRASFAGKQMDVEIAIVYVSIDENGKENVIGRNTTG